MTQQKNSKALLSEAQKQFLQELPPGEQRLLAEDYSSQLRALSTANTRAALVKRAELQARIAFLQNPPKGEPS